MHLVLCGSALHASVSSSQCCHLVKYVIRFWIFGEISRCLVKKKMYAIRHISREILRLSGGKGKKRKKKETLETDLVKIP